jgi:16S rRNA (cytosine967-C5)-methyltransferase
LIALGVLMKSVTSDEGVDALLERALAPLTLDGRERALTVELTYGVLRRLGTLDWRLEPVLDKPLARLPVAVQMLIRLGAYQLLFLDRIPQSAAVHESVTLVKLQAPRLGRDWSGFVNAVLRALIRAPVRPWPAEESGPAKALAIRYSVPEWLSQRWIDRLGVEGAVSACEQSGTTPPVTLRVNRLKITRDAFLAQLRQAGLSAKPATCSPMGIILEEGRPIRTLPGFAEGHFYVEDEAAQLIPPLLDARPGESLLDACAAPGGKSTHLAELMGDRGLIFAVDRKPPRVDLLQRNCQRLGLQGVVPILADIRQRSDWLKLIARQQCVPDEAALIDRILVDAPCSGLGVLRRHPEAKWRKDSAAFARHHRLQVQVLDAVAPCLRPGGVLVYSVCSTEPEETEDVVSRFCDTHAGFERESVAPWLPESAARFLTAHGALSTLGNDLGMDGFYAVRLRKVRP